VKRDSDFLSLIKIGALHTPCAVLFTPLCDTVWRMSYDEQNPPTKYGTTTGAASGQEPKVISAEGYYDGYHLVSHWQIVAGRAAPVSVTLDRRDGGPVTATAIRKLPLGDMLEEARNAVSRMSAVLRLIAERSTIDVGDFDAFRSAGPQRGRSLTPEVLAEVAAVYRDAYFDGRSVQEAVAKHFVISRDAATKRIMKARAHHLLDGIGRGR
jgi:hypothetical protein